MGENSTYDEVDIFNAVIAASTKTTSINQICNSTENTPSDSAIRNRLDQLTMEDLEQALNQMLQIHSQHTLNPGKYHFAIDLTTIPYHGTHYQEEREITRCKAKRGTTHFHAYATIYLIQRNKRYTLGLKFVYSDEKHPEIIDHLLAQIKALNLGVRALYLDKEFYTVEVINHLKEQRIPFIIPVVPRGRKGGGIRKLYKGRESYSTTYTMTSHKNQTKATFQVNIVVKYYKGKYGEKGIEYLGYAVYGLDLPVKRTYQEYRKRFGIESSYSLMNTTRARTSSRKPTIRLLYIGISLLLSNLWIYIKWTYLSQRRKGGRKPPNWTYETMVGMLTIALDRILKPILRLKTYQPWTGLEIATLRSKPPS